MQTIVGHVATNGAAAPQPRPYPKRFNAQRAAIATLGPEAREGFEFITSQIADGKWIWRATDEVPPMTAAQAKINGVTYHPPASPPAGGPDDLAIPAELRREDTPEQRDRAAAIVKADQDRAIRSPRDTRTVSNPKPGTERKPHDADLADLALIPQATGFLASLFINGGFDKRPATTVDEARRLASDMENISGSSRRALVYALLADGRSILVPPSYDPTRPPAAEAAKAGRRSKTPKAPRARKTSAPRPPGDRKRYDWTGAEEKAAAGKIPPAPDFSADTHKPFRALLQSVVAAAKAGDAAALRAIKIKATSSSPKAVERYRGLCLKALKAAA